MTRLVLPGLSILGLAALLGASTPAPAPAPVATLQDTIMGKLEITPTRANNELKLSDKKDIEVAILAHTQLELKDIDQTTLLLGGVPPRGRVRMESLRNVNGGNAVNREMGLKGSSNAREDEGDQDMVFVVPIPALITAMQLAEGQRQVCATGRLKTQIPFKACSDLTISK